MNENLFNVKIIVLNSPHNTRYDRVYSPASIPVLAKKRYHWDHGLLRAVNSLKL